MPNFNANDFDFSQAQDVEEAQALAQTFNPADYDFDDPSPTYADGSSPESAINKSPVSFADRFKLAAGEKEQSIKFLKQKFEDVTTDKYGNYIVKDKGLWHRVDPKHLGDGDAWTRAKELVGDAVDATFKVGSGMAVGATTTAILGPGALVGAAVGGVGAAIGDAFSEEISDAVSDNPKTSATAGGVLLAGGIKALKTGDKVLKKTALPAILSAGMVEGVRTSLGRFVGTYPEDTEQQLKDIGFEMLLTAGGELVAAGVKPTFQTLAKAGGKLKALPDGAKRTWATGIGNFSTVGPDRLYDYMNDPMPVNRLFQEALTEGKGVQGAQTHLVKRGITTVKRLANNSQQALSSIYGKFRSNLLSQVDDSFEAGADDITRSFYMHYKQEGLGRFVMDAPRHAETGLRDVVAREVDLGEIAKHAQSGKRGLPPGVRFEMYKFSELKAREAESGLVQEIVNDPQNYRLAKELYDFMRPYEQMKSLKGKAGAEQLLKLKSAIGNKANKLINTAKSENMPAASRLMSQAENLVDLKFASKFERGEGLPNLYRQLNEDYSVAKQEIQALLNTKRAAEITKSDLPYETYFKQITANKADSNVLKKEAVKKTAQLAQEAGMAEIAQLTNQLRHIEIANSFVPWSGGVLQRGALLASASMAGSGNIPMSLVAAGGAAVSTPRLSRPLTQGAMKVGKPVKVTIDAGFRGLEMMKQLHLSKQLDAFASRPELVQPFFTTMFSSGVEQQMLTDQLVNSVVQQSPMLPPLQQEEQ